MEQGYLLLSWLNDFVFCPYSIYLHEVYGASSPQLIHREAQKKGSLAHESLDEQRYSTRKADIPAVSVMSHEFMLQGKIDLYKGEQKELIERKRQIKRLYDGYMYQLLGQYFCMVEMGYVVEKLSLYSMVDNKKYPLPLPDQTKKEEFRTYVARVRSYCPDQSLLEVNPNKCRHCIYQELCPHREVELC